MWVEVGQCGENVSVAHAMAQNDKIFYVGEFRHSLDAKNRLTVPAKWRFDGDEGDTSYLALPNPNGSITVYPPKMIEHLEEKITSVHMLGDPNKVRALTRIFSRAERFGCDKQGRINLTEKLIKHAGIAKEAVLAGLFTTFHIWSPERFTEHNGDEEGINPEDSAILSELGL